MSLPPNPKIQAHVEKTQAKKKFLAPIPSKCKACKEEFPSKAALDKHKWAKHPTEPPFDETLREKFLVMLRGGGLPNKSIRKVGISPATLKRAMILDPAFAEAVSLAEEEAAEDIEEVLRERALAADPWAVKEWLSKRSKPRWSDDKSVDLNVNFSGEIVHRADLLDHQKKILNIQKTIQERARLNGDLMLNNSEIIDAEIVE